MSGFIGTLIGTYGANGPTFTGTVTQGYYRDTSAEPFFDFDYYGYASYISGSSISSSGTLSDGKTIAQAYDYNTIDYYGGSNYINAYLIISGFSSDPGQNYFVSAQRGASTALFSSAAGYTWLGGGQAQWVWSGGTSIFGFYGNPSGTTSAFVIK
jgi:hypothetical protein